MLGTERRKRAAWFVIGTLIGLLAVLVLYAIFSTRDLAERNTAVLDTVRSCTTPGRPCYEDSRRRTAKVVTDINRVSLLAAACADRPRSQTVEEIQSCVIERLAAQDKND